MSTSRFVCSVNCDEAVLFLAITLLLLSMRCNYSATLCEALMLSDLSLRAIEVEVVEVASLVSVLLSNVGRDHSQPPTMPGNQPKENHVPLTSCNDVLLAMILPSAYVFYLPVV